LKEYKEVGKDQDYTPSQIKEYKGYIDLANKFYKAL
jgi:hypothetical protein